MGIPRYCIQMPLHDEIVCNTYLSMVQHCTYAFFNQTDDGLRDSQLVRFAEQIENTDLPDAALESSASGSCLQSLNVALYNSYEISETVEKHMFLHLCLNQAAHDTAITLRAMYKPIDNRPQMHSRAVTQHSTAEGRVYSRHTRNRHGAKADRK